MRMIIQGVSFPSHLSESCLPLVLIRYLEVQIASPAICKPFSLPALIHMSMFQGANNIEVQGGTQVAAAMGSSVTIYQGDHASSSSGTFDAN